MIFVNIFEPIINCFYLHSDSEEERHRLAEAAVSYDFIAENASPLQSQSKGN